MKILMLDIETSPNTAFVWGLFKENIPLARLIDTSSILCWSAKWYGESEVWFDSIYTSKPKTMLKRIHKMLDEADMVCTYNGNRFDLPVLNKEFLLMGMFPPSPVKSLDLYTTVRRQFRFTSNKLDHIAQQLGLGKKHETSFQLWIDCMNKDPDAWAVMEEYNINDVFLLEAVYEKLKPWIKNHPSVAVHDDIVLACPTCGSKEYQRRGWAITKAGKYPRHQCKDCGSWFRGTKNEGLPIGDRFTNG